MNGSDAREVEKGLEMILNKNQIRTLFIDQELI